MAHARASSEPGPQARSAPWSHRFVVQLSASPARQFLRATIRKPSCLISCSHPHRRCWPAWADLGGPWPSRLVATAAEDGLSVRRNSLHDLLPIEPVSSWCLISHL